MSARFRTCDLNQPYLLPPVLQDWLPEQHLARFIVEVSNLLNLRDIYASYERRDGRGAEAYHPLMLTRLLLYAYCIGRPSSRQIEKATYDDLAFRYLAADQHPDHDTIAAFRQQHLERLSQLFVQALQFCQKAGLVKLGHVALDGTKVLAQASRRKNWKAEKLLAKEQELAKRVEELLGEAARVDAEEDARYGKGRRGDELPAELATAEKRLAKLRQIKKQMEEEAAAQALQLERERAEAGGKARNQTEKKRWQRASKRAEFRHQQLNATDRESRLMKDGASRAMVQGYNAQAVVDSERQVIVAAEVTQDHNDRGQLVPMVERMMANVGAQLEQREQEAGSCGEAAKPLVVLADAGYWSEQSLSHEALQGLDVLVPPDAERPKKQAGGLARNAPRTQRAAAMRERLSRPEEQAAYGLRKAVVEPVFGQIKQGRGLRRFSFRGLAKVRAEWALMCLTHNLLKLYRHQMAVATA